MLGKTRLPEKLTKKPEPSDLFQIVIKQPGVSCDLKKLHGALWGPNCTDPGEFLGNPFVPPELSALPGA